MKAFQFLVVAGLTLLASHCPALRAAPEASPAVVKSEFLFENAPFKNCHASTIEESGGGLVAAFFAGTAEQNPDVGIWVSRQENGKWLAPVEVANGVISEKKRYPCWNPVLFQPKEGPLLLFYKVGSSPKSWWGMLTRSSDGGRTWSEPERLPKGFVGPIKNKPLQLWNGDILYPSSDENLGWRVHVERSDAAVKNWEKTGPLNNGEKIGAIQPSLLSLGGGRLQALGRTREGRLFSVESVDAGRNWGAMSLLGVPNPNSGTDAVSLRDGRQLLVYNHSDSKRSPLNVAVSGNGKTWVPVVTLESEAGEFSYPAVIQSRDGLVHCTYTWNRKFIRHVTIDPMRLAMG